MAGYLIAGVTLVTLYRLLTSRSGSIRIGRFRASWSR